MRSLFIADAHLENPQDERYMKLVRFLKEKGAGLDELYILGDLFDFWVGPSPHLLATHAGILSAIRDLSNSGCRIVYFEGNHDFHLEPFPARHFCAGIHAGPEILTIQQKRFMVCHGDLINEADTGYRRLHRALRSAPVRFLARHLPPRAADAIRQAIQAKSRSSCNASRKQWNYRQIILDYGLTIKREGIDGLICAHFHLPFQELLNEGSFAVTSLGDWITQFSYAEMIDGNIELLTYR